MRERLSRTGRLERNALIKRLASNGTTRESLSALFGLHPSTVSAIVHGRDHEPNYATKANGQWSGGRPRKESP